MTVSHQVREGTTGDAGNNGRPADQNQVVTMRTRRIVMSVLLLLVLGLVVFASISARAQEWWVRASRPGQQRLPAPLRRVLDKRAYTQWLDESDVHAAMWFVVALLALSIVTGWRQRVAVAAAVVGAGCAIELLQSAFTARSAEWIDVAGDALGVAAAGAVFIAVDLLHRVRSR